MKTLLTFICLMLATLAFAHGDLTERIKKLSKQIEKNPDNASLYQKRGELYYQHEEYRKSIVDFEHARARGVQSDELNIQLAKSYFKAKKHRFALEFLEELLAENPNHVMANRWKGRVLVDQSDYTEASKALNLALQHSIKKTPDQYLELAKAINGIKSVEATNQACEKIKEGIQELGDLPVFLSKLVEYYTAIEAHEKALQFQTKLIEISNRKDLPYYNRARLYYRQNNFTAAKADLTLALKEINKLPPKIRNASATKNLHDEIKNLQSNIN